MLQPASSFNSNSALTPNNAFAQQNTPADVALKEELAAQHRSSRTWLIGNIIGIVTLTIAVAISLVVKNRIKRRNTALRARLSQAQSELKSTQKRAIDDLTLEKHVAIDLSQQLATAKQQLQASKRDLEHAIYTISHDLKSPAANIGSYTNLLRLEQDGPLNEKQNGFYERIEQNVNQIDQLQKDLLQLARVMRASPEKSPVDVTILFQRTQSALADQIEAAQATITLYEPTHTLVANIQQLSLCLNHLLRNALLYRSPDRSCQISVATSHNEDYSSLIVEDNGIGIEAKDHERVFKLFETVNHRHGRGVGLTLVKTIVETHNGILLFDSTINQGCRFELLFPNHYTNANQTP